MYTSAPQHTRKNTHRRRRFVEYTYMYIVFVLMVTDNNILIIAGPYTICPYCHMYNLGFMIGLVYDVQRYFQQYFSHIVAVSFIGGGNRSNR